MKLFYTLCLGLALWSCAGTAQSDTVINIEKSELQAVLDDGALLLDVRTPEEIALGSIEGAAFMDYYADDFETQLQKLPKDKPIVVYCKSGGRSSEAASMLVASGWPKVYNLLGGYSNYSEE